MSFLLLMLVEGVRDPFLNGLSGPFVDFVAFGAFVVGFLCHGHQE
jgi:hypothetical protein